MRERGVMDKKPGPDGSGVVNGGRCSTSCPSDETRPLDWANN